MALMAGSLLVQGVAPGPQLLATRPELFWGVIASMWVGNAVLVILNLPLIGIWIKLLSAPYRLLYPAIVLVCSIGAYSLSNSTFDILVVVVFGLAGYVFYLLHCEPAPLMMGFVLGPMVEEYFRRAMQLAHGNPLAIAARPISMVFLIATAVLLLLILAPMFRQVRSQAFQEA